MDVIWIFTQILHSQEKSWTDIYKKIFSANIS